ncbi:DUF2987 domain-containing protein [Aliiglaciecola sp. CAU 1673]|uniref:DUF2987 domain-containing protein n=1 Tax=Aliiglaciecola sp. CAU 1673 TaxID=3032595 RepID=UPI0023DA8990|nr:DUF2987 domain-containing protein [Aliiglaciecola sp. CAU 1673]MDF2179859.1 DUF2987 domain-containing protein [Aliiglaciecola sp. CAU 1673]
MKLFPLALLTSLPFATLAEPLEIEYSALYSHVKKLDEESMPSLQFAFGFVHVGTRQLCDITSAYIHTQKQDMPLVVSKEQRFTVPNERALKLANATVRLELGQAANQCDMSVQLETKPEVLKSQYNIEELRGLFAEYDAFFDEMGGFLSFMMPDVKGLMLQMPEGSGAASLNDQPVALPVQNGRWVLDKAFLEGQGQLTLPVSPLRITALTE